MVCGAAWLCSGSDMVLGLAVMSRMRCHMHSANAAAGASLLMAAGFWRVASTSLSPCILTVVTVRRLFASIW